MTLSATGEAETPAGGSVCIRCTLLAHVDEMIQNGINWKTKVNRNMQGGTNLEVTHQATTGRCRHCGESRWGRIDMAGGAILEGLGRSSDRDSSEGMIYGTESKIKMRILAEE